MMKVADVVVIGAGIVGSATAYYLAKTGIDVTLIDRRIPIASGAATQACAGGVRQQGRVPVEIPLAIYSINLWTDLEADLEADLDYRQNGMTVVTDDENLIPLLTDRLKQEQSLGLDIKLIQGSELHNLIPGLSPQILAGSYCPTDGHADPMRTNNAFIVAAQRLGAHIRWQCPCQGFVIENNRITAVKTPQENIPCRYAILAAGYWSRALAAAAGLNLPFQAFPLQMMVTARRPHVLGQVLGWIGHGISLKQVPSGGYVIGGGWPGRGDPETYQTQLMPGSMAKSAQTTVELFPSLSGVPVVRAWVGIEAFCEDEMQIIGPVHYLEGLILAAGFSGHGFAIGPGVGSLLADYVNTGQMSEMLTPFSIARFTKPTEEKQE
ncbi:MAG: FAD-binding oxidoreductase [Desulfobacteraceae bacterium]|jgi:sarcosine oxidase subunit beta